VAGSDLSIRAAASRHMCPFINTCIDYGFDAAYINRSQQFPYDNAIWRELSRSNVRDLFICRSAGTEKQTNNSTSSQKATRIFQSIPEQSVMFGGWTSFLLPKDQ
jgi:hypothetical protein